MSPGTVRGLRISALWALVISTPISLFGWAMSFWIAHGGGIFLVLFIPFMVLWLAIQACGCKGTLSDTQVAAAAALVQFLGYFVVVLAIRAYLRRRRLYPVPKYTPGLFARHLSTGQSSPAPKTVGEIEIFITMLLTACQDPTVNERLERLLSLPDQKRQATVHAWVSDLLIAQAPREFIAAVACLLDDKVAEKAYEVIYKCKRGERF